MRVAHEIAMLYLIAFDLHFWGNGALSQIKSETGSCNPSPGFTRVNSSTDQVNSSTLSGLPLAWVLWATKYLH